MSYLLANTLGLVGLVGVFYLTGWAADHILLAGRGLAPVAGVGRFGLGAAVWIALLFLMAAVGLLNPPMLGLMLLLTLAGVWRYRRASGVGLLPDSAAGPRIAEDWSARLVGCGMAVLLFVIWVQASWPSIAWDADVYHLTVPRLYLEHGGFRRIPFNVYSNWPLNTQMLYSMALMISGSGLAKLLHFTFGFSILVTIYRIVKRESTAWAGWIGASLFLLNPVVLDEMRAAYVDLAFAFFFLLAFFFVHLHLES